MSRSSKILFAAVLGQFAVENPSGAEEREPEGPFVPRDPKCTHANDAPNYDYLFEGIRIVPNESPRAPKENDLDDEPVHVPDPPDSRPA